MTGTPRSVITGLTVSALAVGALSIAPSPLAAARPAAPKVTGVAVSRGPLSGGTDVVVVGKGFTRKTTARFGRTPARKVTYASPTRMIVRTPKHAAGTVHIRVTTAGRRSAAGKADRFLFTTAPSRLTWRKPVPTAAQTAVSCASASFCASVGNAGRAAVFRSGTPTATTMPDTARMTAVSCPTATFCAATDVLGRTTIFDGTTWSAPQAHAGMRAPTALSCPTTTFCMATDGYATLRYNGVGWTRRDMHSTTLTGLDCTSPSFCLAVSEHRNQTTWNGRTWSPYARALPADIQDPHLDCTKPGFCVVVGFYPYVYVRHGTTWSTAVSLDIVDRDSGSDFQTAGLSCASEDLCVIGLESADESSVVRAFRSASVTAPAASTFPSTPVAVSCPTTHFCAAAGYGLTTATR